MLAANGDAMKHPLLTVSLMTVWIAGTLVALSGCGDKSDGSGDGGDGKTFDDTSSGDGTGDGTSGTDECLALDAKTCLDDETCATIDARRIIENGPVPCVDMSGPPSGVGCHSASTSCDAHATLAAGPDDPTRCWWFADSCIPDTWTECEYQELEACPDPPGGG